MPTSDFEMEGLRVPPHSLESEQSVLGALMLDNNAWDRIADVISASDFYRYDHRYIFEAIVSLINRCIPADVITVFEQLQMRGKAEEGTLQYLNLIAQSTPSSGNIHRYAGVVRNRGILRRLIDVTNEIADQAYRPNGKDEMAILDEAEAKILAIAEARGTKEGGAKSLQPLLAQVVDRVDELYNREDQSEVTGVPTGFTDLDSMTTGLQPGDLIVVAGRPSMGKTAFAVNIGENVAVEAGKTVLIFSMEMSGAQLATRLLGSAGKIDQQRLRTGRLEEADWPRLTHGIQKLTDTNVFIDEDGSLSPGEVRARARRVARQNGGLGLIIVDYMQLMVGTTKSQGGQDNRANEVSEISRALKGLAKELNCPVMALSQLNRSLENRPNKRPVMADLRESGAIEQDADVILFIYRDEVYDPGSPDKGTAEIIIGKQRNGPTGIVRLSWMPEFTKFANYARQQ